MKNLIYIIPSLLILVSCKNTLKKETKINNHSNKFIACDSNLVIDLVNAIQNANFVFGKSFVKDSIRVYHKNQEGGLPAFMKNYDRETDSLVTDWIKSKSLFENPGVFTPLFNLYSKDIVDAAKHLCYTIDGKDYYILSSHTNEINAETFPILNCDKKLILFNDKFAIFCYEMARDLNGLFNYKFYSSTKAHNQNKLNNKYIDLKFSYSNNYDSLLENGSKFKVKMNYAAIAMHHLGISSWVEDSLRNDKSLAFTEFLTSGLEHFVVAHELAHVVRNHVGQNKTMFLYNSQSDTIKEIKTFKYNWAQELEADYYGTLFFSDYLKNDKPNGITSSSLKRWSPLILMTNNELYNKIQLIKKGIVDKWEEDIDVSNFRDALKLLPNNPTTNDFLKLINDNISNSSNSSKHPAEIYRKCVIKYSLLKSNMITLNEYNSKDNFEDTWYCGMRLLYNSTRKNMSVAYETLSK